MRDLSSVSPSAKALLLVKAQTDLPYARAAAERLFGAAAVDEAAREAAGKPGAEGRRAHFELRARSLDEALARLGATHVLEIAAGLSMRGLALAAREAVHYVDTDLPGIAALKADLVAHLRPASLAGSLEVCALDALDADAFGATVDAMPAGPLAVVHEGLLMYLDAAEKARLAASVRSALRARGGAWITADVYVRSATSTYRDEKTKRFLAEHRVEEQKFADLDDARAFFEGQGFVVRERLVPAADPWPVRQTWILEARDDGAPAPPAPTRPSP